MTTKDLEKLIEKLNANRDAKFTEYERVRVSAEGKRYVETVRSLRLPFRAIPTENGIELIGADGEPWSEPK